MIPVLFHIGPFPINSFGLMMVCAFVAAHRRLFLSLERGGERPELAEPMIFWAALGGILGARIDYIVTLSEGFFRDPLGVLFSGAGFVFYGGFIGGVVSVWILLRRNRCDFLRYADLTGAALAVGYGVGRIGCLLSGDGDYGIPTTLPWGMDFSHGIVPTPPGIKSHPAPLYETILALLTAAFLVRLERSHLINRKGAVFGIYLFLTGFARYCVEFVRIEPVVFQGLTQAQLVALIVMASGVLLLMKSSPARKTV